MQSDLPSLPMIAQQMSITEQTRFRRIFAKVNSPSIEQLDYRRERQVYLLTNGKRTIVQIASLLAIQPVEVAHMMKRLLEQEYVEFVPFNEDELSRAI
jgi:DNA-binding MarR family transcriptional regulator